MNKDYCIQAANWWAEKIKQTQLVDSTNLDLFKKNLALKINDLTRVNPSLVISTYETKSTLLQEAAFYSSLLNIQIPSGYEMRILFDNVMVYDTVGMLVASF